MNLIEGRGKAKAPRGIITFVNELKNLKMTNKNFKAAPASPEESAKIQQYWFDNFGAEWINSGKREMYIYASYLFLENGLIGWSNSIENYNETDLPIFSLPEKNKMEFIGKLITVDFLENTMIFKIEGLTTFQAGKYKIIQM